MAFNKTNVVLGPALAVLIPLGRISHLEVIHSVVREGISCSMDATTAHGNLVLILGTVHRNVGLYHFLDVVLAQATGRDGRVIYRGVGGMAIDDQLRPQHPCVGDDRAPVFVDLPHISLSDRGRMSVAVEA